MLDVRIFTGDHFIERGHVVVKDGFIARVEQGNYVDARDRTINISKPGHTLMPGLIDAHIHALRGNTRSLDQSLRFGVTTVCDMHNEPHHIANLRKLAGDPENRSIYSDFKCAGVGATIRSGWPEGVYRLHSSDEATLATIESWPKLSYPSEAEPYVQQQMKESGASYIKLFHELGDSLRVDLPRPSLELQRALVEAAHAHGLLAVGHAFSFQGATELLECGVDGLNHAFFDKATSDAYITLALRNKAHLNPTLTVCASQTRESDAMQTRFAADPLAQRLLFDSAPRKPLGLAAPHTKAENAYACTRGMYEAGVPMMVGSDSSGQERGNQYGLGMHMEMHAMVHMAGISVMDVLKGATSLPADRFGFDDRGRIEAGRKADLLLVEGDVRGILAREESLCLPIEGVWRDGVVAEVWKDVIEVCDR